MTASVPAHPLDVDIADLVDGVLEDARTARLEAHLSDCLPCQVKRRRLTKAPPAPTGTDLGAVAPAFTVPAPSDTAATADPTIGELWLAGTGEQALVLVRAVWGDRVLVAPVTFDVEAADEETLVVVAVESPLPMALAVHPLLATEVPRAALTEQIASLADDAGTRRGPPIVDATDPRIEVRQYLADALAALDERPADPGTAADAPPPPLDQVRSSLISDLRAFRGRVCSVRPLDRWGDVLAAHRAGWVPLATIDEVGIVLLVLDTPHGLADDADFDTARAVLTRFNATALVVLAGAISGVADVFDASSLNYGIDAPSGRHTPPRPLVSGLAPFDAVAKFLDQSTGARAAAPPSRGPVTRVDVGDILRDAAAAAIADAVRQGSRFKIAPKRQGYESLAGDEERFAAALGQAFGPDSVVQDLLDLAPRTGG